MKITIPKKAFEEKEPLQPGNYIAQLTKVELRDSKAGDSQYLNWEFTLLEEGFEGKLVWLITSLKENAMWKLVELLSALGANLSKIEKTEEVDPESLIGNKIELEIGEEEYEGKIHPKVIGFEPIS